MKAGFSLTQDFVPSFRGNRDLPADQQFIVTLNMPVVEDVFTILDRLQQGGATKLDQVTMIQARDIVHTAGDYVPKYITAKQGAEDFTIDQVVKYAPFFPLAVELLFELVRFAQPDEADTKNS